MVQDLPSLLWIINLGCIDLNPWYARCDDTDRPDFLHFDLDPGPGSDFAMRARGALRVRDILDALDADYAKTTGSKGIHVYIPIVRGPRRKKCGRSRRRSPIELERRHPEIITAEYRREAPPRPRARRLQPERMGTHPGVDLFGAPDPFAGLDAVTWEEIEQGVAIEDFRIDNAVARLEEVGDLWKPLLQKRGRTDLSRYVGS